MYGQEPFVRAANSPVLHKAFNQLVGAGKWRPREDLGTFPIRFPSHDDPGDTGWHIDASFPPETGGPTDYMNWRVNVTSKERALLMFFLFSDIGENDAPTRISTKSFLGRSGASQGAFSGRCHHFFGRPFILEEDGCVFAVEHAIDLLWGDGFFFLSYLFCRAREKRAEE